MSGMINSDLHGVPSDFRDEQFHPPAASTNTALEERVARLERLVKGYWERGHLVDFNAGGFMDKQPRFSCLPLCPRCAAEGTSPGDWKEGGPLLSDPSHEEELKGGDR